MRVLSKRFCDWKPGIKTQLRKLVLTNGYLKHYIVAAPQSVTYVAFSDDGLIMGWLLVLCFNYRLEANVYVHSKFRNLGLGTKLILRASRKHTPLYLCQWNSTTEDLFYKLAGRYPRRLKVFKWQKYEKDHIEWLQSFGINVY